MDGKRSENINIERIIRRRIVYDVYLYILNVLLDEWSASLVCLLAGLIFFAAFVISLWLDNGLTRCSKLTRFGRIFVRVN